MDNDMISRKAAMTAITAVAKEMRQFPRVAEYRSKEYAFTQALEAVAGVPCVDAEPVRHGKWIATGEYEEWYAEEYKCSICGGRTLGNRDGFCYSCGAKMEGGITGEDI